MAFFFKLYPEIIQDGRLYIAEPPLYRVADKKNPFVINKEDYIDRYVKAATKEYKIGVARKNDVEYFDKKRLVEFLTSTKSYVDDLSQLAEHYKLNDRLLEMIIEEIASYDTGNLSSREILNRIYGNINNLATRVAAEFPEIYFDDNDNSFKGVIDKKHQLHELTESSVEKSRELAALINQWESDGELQLVNIKTGTTTSSRLLGVLKVLRKYQPDILHRFKGLGENNHEDIKTTIMDPNTRTLIRVQIGDIENDMKVFQTLRGNSPFDAQNRKLMMKSYVIPRDLIDT